MNCLAVIDTNVIVSALLSSNDDAATVQVINRVIDKQIIPVYSDIIMKEYGEVLRRDKFGFSENTVKYLLSVIREFGIYTDPKHVNIKLPDMKDLPFYEVVIDKRNKDAYLVTGNIKHFPREPFIVTARRMINILDGLQGNLT